MKIRSNTSPQCLSRDQILVATGAYGSTIECRRGLIWITQDGDPRDIVLARGDRFTFDRETPAVISALDDSSIELRPAPRSRPSQGVVRWLTSALHGVPLRWPANAGALRVPG